MNDQHRPVTLERRVTIHGISISTTEIEVDPADFAHAVDAEQLDHEYDTYLSDMDGETVIVDHLGVVHRPYGGEVPDDAVFLMDLLEPILRHVPTWRIDQYAAARRSEEE